MLKIRLQRIGRINDPSYRVIVTEHARSPKTGNFVEKVGTYNPKTKMKTLNAERIKYWLSVGAKASGTMHNMLVSAGIVSGKKVNVLPKKTVPKPEPAESAEAVAEAPAPAPAAGEPEAEPVAPAEVEAAASEASEEKAL